MMMMRIDLLDIETMECLSCLFVCLTKIIQLNNDHDNDDDDRVSILFPLIENG